MGVKALLFIVGAILLLLGGAWFVDRVLPRLLAETLPKADRILIEKSARRLILLRGSTVIKSYPIQLGGNPLGHKERQGDERTPEGGYDIDWRNPGSRFHLSLHISYPNEKDRGRAKARGEDPGGQIMIHGVPNGAGILTWFFASRDWTKGCVAVSNVAIEEIWISVDDGTPVTIRE